MADMLSLSFVCFFTRLCSKKMGKKNRRESVVLGDSRDRDRPAERFAVALSAVLGGAELSKRMSVRADKQPGSGAGRDSAGDPPPKE